MSRSTRRAASVAVAALLVGATASGCQAGFDAFTNRPYAPSNGSVASKGDMRVRNTVLVQAADASGTQVYASFVNNGSAPDTLVGISLSGVGAVALTDGPITVPAGSKVDLGPTGYRVFANRDLPGYVIGLMAADRRPTGAADQGSNL